MSLAKKILTLNVAGLGKVTDALTGREADGIIVQFGASPARALSWASFRALLRDGDERRRDGVERLDLDSDAGSEAGGVGRRPRPPASYGEPRAWAISKLSKSSRAARVF